MKGFFYDTLLDEENICNLEREKKMLQQGVLQKKKFVVCGARNTGKTSLVKNVVIPYFQKKHSKSFALFVDLMEVKSLESIHQRIQIGFESAFSSAFPAKNLVALTKQFLSQLRPEVSFDSLTGSPTLSLGISRDKKSISFLEIFTIINKKISKNMSVLLVLDEFQDIALIPEAQGLFRQAFQELRKIPLILMGSKKHILSQLFAKPNAPLASFGEDLEFEKIAYEVYHQYISERFHFRKLKIDFPTARELQDALFRIPESINIVCADLCENHERKKIETQDIFQSIDHVLEKRRSRFEEWLSHFSEKEEEILVALAKFGPIKHPTSQVFLKEIHSTARTISLTISSFLDKSVIERNEEGFCIADPLLFYFLKKFR